MPDLTPPPPKTAPSKSILPWVFGGLSFIPCLGVPFGLVAIVLAFIKGPRGAAYLGGAGITCTVLLYGTLFYMGMIQRGGVYDGLRAKMAVTMLNSTVKEIEYYKLQHGSYPTSLEELKDQEKDSFPSSSDPTSMERGNMNELFFYQLDSSGKYYYLRSVGADGKPFTSDDILPSIPPEELKNSGLRIDRPEGK